MDKITDAFKEIWLIDTEFNPGFDGSEKPSPVCLVGWELRSGRKLRLWYNELGPAPPFSIGPEILFVAFYASAEAGFFKAMGWPAPVRVLDLRVEYRNRYNCLPTIDPRRNLISALTQHGLSSIGVTEKKEMITLILRGGPWTWQERIDILDYCESDVYALSRLLPAMLGYIDLPRAIYRGRYMSALGSVETTGSPIDIELMDTVVGRWDSIIDRLIEEVDANYGVYEGRSFIKKRFIRYLNSQGMWWPEENGKVLLNSRTFHAMAQQYPQVRELRELMDSVAKMRLKDLPVGHDGFNRCLLSAFGQKASRNSPSSARFIFGPSCWMRGFIKPPPGWGLAYIDWEQQEFGVAAALSNDPNMLYAYNSGDAYLGFAKQANRVPETGTKDTHEKERGTCKTCVLGIGYGMEEESLSRRIERPLLVARELLQSHHYLYRKYWGWSNNRIERAMLTGQCQTVYGWTYHVNPRAINRGDISRMVRSIRNFPMQSHGAEILRLAVCYAVEAGILVCALVHDAVLIMAPLDRIDADAALMARLMATASRVVLRDRLTLRTEGSEPKRIVRYPHRYMDKRGKSFFEKVMSLL
jgi:DNA polymerase I